MFVGLFDEHTSCRPITGLCRPNTTDSLHSRTMDKSIVQNGAHFITIKPIARLYCMRMQLRFFQGLSLLH